MNFFTEEFDFFVKFLDSLAGPPRRRVLCVGASTRLSCRTTLTNFRAARRTLTNFRARELPLDQHVFRNCIFPIHFPFSLLKSSLPAMGKYRSMWGVSTRVSLLEDIQEEAPASCKWSLGTTYCKCLGVEKSKKNGGTTSPPHSVDD